MYYCLIRNSSVLSFYFPHIRHTPIRYTHRGLESAGRTNLKYFDAHIYYDLPRAKIHEKYSSFQLCKMPIENIESHAFSGT